MFSMPSGREEKSFPSNASGTHPAVPPSCSPNLPIALSLPTPSSHAVLPSSPSCASLHPLLCPAVSHPQPHVPPSQSCSFASPRPQIPVLVCCSIPAPPALSTMLMVLMMSDPSGRTKAGCARWRWWQKAVVQAGCQPVLEDYLACSGRGSPSPSTAGDGSAC